MSNVNLRTLRVERAAEHDLLGILGNLDEAARPDEGTSEVRHVDVAVGIGFPHPEERDVHAAAAVVVELLDRRQDGIGISRRAEQRVVQQLPVVDALLDAHPQGVTGSLLGDHAEDPARDAEAEVQ